MSNVVKTNIGIIGLLSMHPDNSACLLKTNIIVLFRLLPEIFLKLPRIILNNFKTLTIHLLIQN